MNNKMNENILDPRKEAHAFAGYAHEGQFRWDGKTPYIAHPMRVAMEVADFTGRKDTTDDVVVAWLHDVVEDTPVTLEDIRDLEWSTDDQVDALDAITKRPGERYVDYIVRVKKNDIAVRVKIADINDNMNDGKISKGKRQAYEFALAYLKGEL
tara:strand:+ start:1335 stop:1796 length:462 start_codon:yes stop_codon:yes gene_type:complete